jgi:phosphomannomutase
LTQELIISVSGLRGIVGESLSADVARRYAAAFADTLPDGRMLVTRDGRANGAALVEPVVAGLSHTIVRQVFDGGIAATPTTGVLVRQLGCVGGVQISASHNPAEYNGLKLFSAVGRVVPNDVGQRVLERYRMLDSGCSMLDTGHQESSIQHPAPSIKYLEDTTSAHLTLIERIVDVAGIRKRRFSVLLDANHGSGSVLGIPLLERLGCKVTAIGSEPYGQFAHPPEPTAENLTSVREAIPLASADVGFCQDPDADRLAIIDERGRYLGEEYTLAICADHVLRRTPGPVVTNCSTSRMTEDIARRCSVPFFRSAVGEANVVDEMLRRNAILGGEGNGGVIDPRVGLVRDSFVGMALVLDAMASRGQPISSLADELPRYAICKSRVELRQESVPAALDALERSFSDAAIDRLDGLRLDWSRSDGSGCWLLVRASNTEPIMRIIAEASSAQEAQRLCDEAIAVIHTVH